MVIKVRGDCSCPSKKLLIAVFNKVSNVFHSQSVHCLVYQGLDVRLDASGHLLEPLDLEGLLDLGEAALHAVVVGAGRQIEDVLDAERVEPIGHLPTPMDRQVIPEQADLPALGLFAELFDVLEELGHVDGLLEGLPTDNAVLRRHRQDQGVGSEREVSIQNPEIMK